MTFVHQNLLDMVFKWTNDEGGCVYKCDYKECRNENIHWIDHSNWVYNLKMKWNLKSKNENVLQLWSKEVNPLFNTKWGAIKGFEIFYRYILMMQMQKLE